MKKMILLVSFSIAIVLSIASLVVVLASDNKSGNENDKKGDVILQIDVIKNKETALKIGVALLEEYCPDAFLNPDISFDAVEKNGVWRVNNVFQREGITEDGKIWTIDGGEIYVEFRKSNGEVLKIGIND